MHVYSPFRMTVCGPSQSGKSTFVKNLILKKDSVLCGEPIKKIIWCCKSKEFVPRELCSLPNFIVHEGVTNIDQVSPNTLIVIDDLMLEAFTKEVCELFTVNSHHKNISVILVLQNLFHHGKSCRLISLNANYIVLNKAPRDSSQFSFLARQICPQNWKALENVYKEATHKPYTYLLIDLTQRANEVLRYKTNIFNKNYFECFSTLEDVKKHCEEVEADNEQQIYTTSPFSS